MTSIPDSAPTALTDRFALEADARAALFLEARSNTEFADREVPASVIRAAYDLAKWAPTSYNINPLRVAVAESPEARAAVISQAVPGNQAKLERAPLILVAARDDRYHEHFEVTAPGDTTSFDKLDADPQRRTAAAHDAALMQLGYFIVALRAEGLVLRPYGGFSRTGLKEALFAESSWYPEVLLGVGYPPADGEHGAGVRKGRLDAATAVHTL